MELTEKVELLAGTSQVSFTVRPSNGDPMYHRGILPNFERWISYLLQSFSPDKDIECLFTDSLMYIAHIRCDEGDVYIGPVSAIKCDQTRVKSLLRQYHHPLSALSESVQYFEKSGAVSMGKFVDLAALSYYVITGRSIDTNDLILHSSVNYDPVLEKPTYTPVEETHNGQQMETSLFSNIQFGIPVEKAFDFDNAGSVNEGTLSFSPTNHRRYLFISSVAIAARYAVSGGMDYSLAMSIADGYILLLDRTTNVHTMLDICNDMFKTYSHMVSELQLNFPQSATVYKIRKLISSRIEEKITVQSLADELGLSRTFISSHFKSATGKNLNDYINEQKINRAKVLLKTTRMPIIDISELLAFSSQSYFQSIFKKLTGLTPREYQQQINKPFEM